MDRRSDGRSSVPLGELVDLISGEIDGDRGLPIRGVAEVEVAGAQEIAFCTVEGQQGLIAQSSAAAVIVSRDWVMEPPSPRGPALVWVDDPRLAIVKVLRQLYPDPPVVSGIHPTAVVVEDARLGTDVSIGAHAVVGAGCTVGDGVRMGPGCVLEEDVTIGAQCVLHSNVTIYRGVEIGDRVILHSGSVLGADGFGYAADGHHHIKMPQVGGVVIADDVEIGANSCVDRATFGATRIGRRTKIDNMVQIGHNCQIGDDCVLSGQVGLAGSTIIEDRVLVGGNVGTAGHLRIGAGARIGAKSGVHRDVPPGAVVMGYPELEISVYRRVMAALPRLPRLLRRVRRLEGVLEVDQEKPQ